MPSIMPGFSIQNLEDGVDQTTRMVMLGKTGSRDSSAILLENQFLLGYLDESCHEGQGEAGPTRPPNTGANGPWPAPAASQ